MHMFCLDRPELSVYWGNYETNINIMVGKIKEPCTCINVKMDIMDPNGLLRYKIDADGCQCGICCRGSPCGKCSEVWFPLFSAKKDYFSFETKDGHIIRKFAGCFQSQFTTADNFDVVFPIDATPDDKLMIIGTALMIDYRYYSEDPNNNDVQVQLNV